jgi:hypothetical protein
LISDFGGRISDSSERFAKTVFAFLPQRKTENAFYKAIQRAALKRAGMCPNFFALRSRRSFCKSFLNSCGMEIQRTKEMS